MLDAHPDKNSSQQATENAKILNDAKDRAIEKCIARDRYEESRKWAEEEARRYTEERKRKDEADRKRKKEEGSKRKEEEDTKLKDEEDKKTHAGNYTIVSNQDL